MREAVTGEGAPAAACGVPVFGPAGAGRPVSELGSRHSQCMTATLTRWPYMMFEQPVREVLP